MPKFLRVTFIALLALILCLVVVIHITGNNHLYRALNATYLSGHITANINDHREFKTRLIEAGQPQPWPKHVRYNSQPLPGNLLRHLMRYDSAAFLVAIDGQLYREHYFNGYSADSQTNSFSMAKTVLTMLVGMAIEDGYIDQFETPILQFLPEFEREPLAQQATLEQLSAMTSGYDWDEHYYSPLSPTPKLYYGFNSARFLLKRGFVHEPGSTFYYSSASTQLLGIALSRALGEKTISEYLSEKLWQPLGMHQDALWHTDARGMELVYCCISSNARDFAKLGQLLLNGGNWQGQQLLPQTFVERMRTPTLDASYGHSLWLNNTHNPPFYLFQGHLGQYIIIVPQHRLVIVRLGETRYRDTLALDDRDSSQMPREISFFVQSTLSMLNAEGLLKR